MKTLTIGDLKVHVPIIQGGMGVGISLSGLASAVANEGGIGVISSAGLGLLYNKLSSNFGEASILGLKEELKKALINFKGTILLVSHEPEFYQDWVTDVWNVETWTTKIV